MPSRFWSLHLWQRHIALMFSCLRSFATPFTYFSHLAFLLFPASPFHISVWHISDPFPKCLTYSSNIDFLISFPSISFPRQSHPSYFCLANSSIRGKSPHSSTIRSRISSGFLLCPIILASHTCGTAFDTLLGLPLVPSRQISELERVQKPSPIKNVSAFLFRFTQLKPQVL